MKKIKYLPLLLLSLLLNFSVVACSDDSPSDEPSTPTVKPDDKPDPEEPTDPSWVDVTATPDAWDNVKRADMTYQLLVYSFADGNGDKYGDIQGIINKLDYINSLGVKAIWLSPIHPSSSYHGYDVTDYTAVNEKFGTKEDLKALIDAANAKGIKIYLDYVLNHTSVNHPWFEKAKASANNPERDYYIFSKNPAQDIKDGKIDMIATEGTGGYNAGEWFTADGDVVKACYKFELDWSTPSKPTVTVTEGYSAEVGENTDTDTKDARYIWFGDGNHAKFFNRGNGKYDVTIDFESNWGFLIRTTLDESWPAGTKYGASSQTSKLTLGQAFSLNNSAAENIVFSDMDLWQYHSHFYTGSFADLNYGKVGEWDNSPVYKHVVDAAKDWMAMGVGGFRLDAVKHIYHNAKGYENPDFLKKFYTDLSAAYTGEGNLYMVGEVLSGSDEVAPYYQGLPALFEFDFWHRLEWAINNGTGCYFAKDIYSYQQKYAGYRSDYIEATKLSNHDEDRTGYKLDKSVSKEKLAAAVLLTSAGSPYIYYGEELGFCNAKSSGDENVREPMQWGDGNDADFGVKYTKSDVASVKEQEADANSLLNVYKKFTQLRNTYPALAQGTMSKHTTYNENNATAGKEIAAWYMTKDAQKMLVIHNFSASAKEISLSDKLDKAVAVNGTVKSKADGENTLLSMGAYSTVVYLMK